MRLKKKALRTAELIGKPSFYNECRYELQTACKLLETNTILRECRSYLDESFMGTGHGLAHSEAVAKEAGAILQVESGLSDLDSKLVQELIVYVQIAGLLHDIRRKEKNHTVCGSDEARRILENFRIGSNYKRYIASAIRNHEAFKDILESENEIAKLISDSLYDADKFRWGPDNFTTTVWLILDSTKTSVEILCRDFIENLRYIERIKGTFRTETGKRYGPEFIDMGIMIGNVIYEEMTSILKRKESNL